MKVLVVGGGPAGLTAALLAAEAGHDVDLVEASERFGGMSASINVGGQRVDLGSHRLHPAASDNAMGLLRRLLGNDLQTRRRHGRILLHGNYVPFPLSIGGMVGGLPRRFAMGAARDALAGPLRKPTADTFAEVIQAGLGPTVLDAFYGPYARKLWGQDAGVLSGELARRRVSVSSPLVLARKLWRSLRHGPTPFLYPRLGYGQVVDRLVEACLDADVTLHTNATVSSLRSGSESPGSAMEVRCQIAGVGEWTGTRVLWTVAPTALLKVAEIEAADTGGLLPHRAVVCSYLVLDQAQYTEFDAHYFPDPAILPARLSEPKNYRTGDDPHERTVLCAEIVCDVGDDVWAATSETLAERVGDALVKAGLPRPRPIESHVERLPSVYPVIRAGDEERLRLLLDQAHSVEGVTLLGRQGLAVADNLHHVMDMAFAAVACLDHSTGWNDAAWREALAAFETHVVED